MCDFKVDLDHYEATVFENHKKCFIQHCERSELRLHFEWTKVHTKCQKWSILASFWKNLWSNSVTRQVTFKGQKMVQNAKNSIFKILKT